MVSSDSLIDRSNVLIETGQFVTLATHSPENAWASTVNFVPLRGPLRFLWYSQRHVRHSRNIDVAPEIAGSIFRTDAANELGLDGAQFTGIARAIEEAAELAEYADFYYTRNFPDEQVREQWRRPLSEFHGEGHRRFYEVTVNGWWLLDVGHWLATMNDQRIDVDLAALQQAPKEPVR
ncbi:pyridoxamine 5'-phosphate oxidase family protein [Sciscionella sediminilitoris]|uniref:pyridoxamine 5'-phosphate oxidase family protein n=1 Tax=Sciscionella sediminilitoris TaxID=1445613 RepID=UPI0004DEE2C9|nr:pyridoxamine 5'-phosphate oxidase family protein [Sciscionella sp. SE31]